jgi:hypothetical protein
MGRQDGAMTETDHLRLVSLADAARAFGRTPGAFREAARAGRLTTYQPGRELLTTMADAAEYIATQQPGHWPVKRKENA